MRRMAWLYLTLKYWLKGDPWRLAGEYAYTIVYGFKWVRRKWDHE
jgi:hypothetical protein